MESENNLENLKFPIGKYEPVKQPSVSHVRDWIETIGNFPELIIQETQLLNPISLNWKYRPEGWSIKQVVHHCADSHINAYVRFKLALTEEKPTIRPYLEAEWALLPDSQEIDLSASWGIISNVHTRWVQVLKSLNSQQLQREYAHPEHGETFNLAETVGNYAWHCQHHLAHIKGAIESEGKY